MILQGCLVFLLVSLISKVADARYHVLCYYMSEAINRPGNGSIAASDLPSGLCTHYFYAFLSLNTDGTIQIHNPDIDIEKGNLRALSDLKKKNPSLKILFSVGGAAADTGVIAAVATDPQKRKALAESSIKLCKEYNYDGIDIDWEYPLVNATFIDLLRDLKEALKPEGLLLTAAVDQLPFNAAYDVKNMTKYLDIINIMTYDYHSPYYQTGQNSPLYFTPKEGEWQRDNLNANSSIVHWMEYGAEASKIVMGCGFYGKAMILADPNNHDIMAPVASANNPGPYTNNIGTLGYNELCDYVFKENPTVVWDDDQKVPYLYKDTLWVGYDDERSVALKAKYVKDHDLFGLMMWSVETDDAHGNCGKGNWPLLRSINSVLLNGK